MTWEEKVMACQCIGEFSLKMRAPGNWYVNHPVERVEDCVLSGGCISGATPEAAVDEHWMWLTGTEFPVIRTRGNKRVKWIGFMWVDVS